MSYKHQVAEKIASALVHLGVDSLTKENVYNMLETPPNPAMGDIAFPCFQLAKALRKAPPMIAAELTEQISGAPLKEVKAVGPYVNLFLDQEMVAQQVISTVLSQGKAYGDSDLGQGRNVPIDLSSPNIAKPFSMGHLRSTVIGNAIANIMEKQGYKPVRINHLGDWGTQFGKLIVAYKLWGDEEKVKAEPIKELLSLYIRFHEEAENDPSLEDQGREWFKKLEDGDTEAKHLWTWFRDESLKEFMKIYDLMNVSFDSTNGEAFYNDKMDRVVQLLEEKGLLTESDGAQVVTLDEYDMPPSLIKKSDGATLYATRDLAAALYRHETYDFAKAVYVVGNEQRLHFQQLYKVLEKMGYPWAANMYHIPFGMMLKDGKKMSTRKGKVVLLEEVLAQAIADVQKVIEEKNPSLANKEEVSRQVGVGAVIFHDLKNYRLNDINFSWEEMLTFEGETGPYVQYTHARACSLLRKGNYQPESQTSLAPGALDSKEAWAVVTLLNAFPDIVERAGDNFDPSLIGKYVIDLAQVFNKFYANIRILAEEEEIKASRLQLVAAVTTVLKEGLRLLGLAAPEEM
ncbi:MULTISPECIES: arginine--tRNA ligase [Brevibacillus]|uniref:Arginine--tRNA ligase n=1 Tax=Brevibacillus invocatus TaxID=173959 RepID=A0A3M8CL27_9BACL|nr:MULTISPECIES: arginine--tRNA ligase [Brevibacillus]CFJ16989.1 arginyl-tRNA synthetase [Mycobacterium tuberculosis]MCM3081037.1 arginine--tRNA ligase [Brevibacillus invocatus]MCM3431328.1 arginine--tRNA ligase [Brevibacillus invocatus]MDH4615777.1 arginine--tRNA ligase [Brevibacillus sp. AY1]RNB75575.1 arginine--tRNA ligase [Brevibacillus invocatus]